MEDKIWQINKTNSLVVNYFVSFKAASLDYAFVVGSLVVGIRSANSKSSVYLLVVRLEAVRLTEHRGD